MSFSEVPLNPSLASHPGSVGISLPPDLNKQTGTQGTDEIKESDKQSLSGRASPSSTSNQGWGAWLLDAASNTKNAIVGYTDATVKATVVAGAGKLLDFKINAEEQYKQQEADLNAIGFDKPEYENSKNIILLLRERLQKVAFDLARSKAVGTQTTYTNQVGAHLFEQRQTEIYNLIGVLFGAMITNIIKQTYGQRPEELRNPDEFVGQVVEQFLKINKMLFTPELTHQITTIQSSHLSPQQKNEELAKLLRSVSEQFLRLAFPNGPTDLPVAKAAQSFIWGLISDPISKLMPEWYNLVVQPSNSPGLTGFAIALEGHEQADDLKSVVKAFTQQAPRLAAKFIDSSTQEKLSALGANALTKTKLVQEWLRPCLKKQIAAILKDNPNQKELWSVIQNSLEGTISHLLGTLSIELQSTSHEVFHDEMKNLLGQLIEVLLTKGVDLVKKIDVKDLERIERLPESPIKEEAKKELCSSIASELVSFLHLSELPYYKLLNKTVHGQTVNRLESEILPKLIYSLYRDLSKTQREQAKYQQQLQQFVQNQMKSIPAEKLEEESLFLSQQLEGLFGTVSHKVIKSIQKGLLKELNDTPEYMAVRIAKHLQIAVKEENLAPIREKIVNGDSAQLLAYLAEKLERPLSKDERKVVTLLSAQHRAEEQVQKVIVHFNLIETSPATQLAIKEAIIQSNYELLSQLVGRNRRVSLNSDEEIELAAIIDGKVVAELNKLLFNNSLDPKGRRLLKGALREVISGQQKGSQQVWNYLQQTLTNMALRSVVGLTQSEVAQKAQARTKAGQGSFLSNLAGEMLGLLHGEMRNLYPAVEAILRQEERKILNAKKLSEPEATDSYLRNKYASEITPALLAKACIKDIEELFSNLSEKTLHQIFPQGAKDLPVPDFVKEKLFKTIQGQLNTFLTQSYLESITWIFTKEQNRKVLKDAYETLHAENAAHLFARFVGDFVPHVLSNIGDQEADKIVGSVEKAANQVSPDLSDYVKNHSDQAKAELNENIKNIAAHSNVEKAIDDAEEFTKAALLNLMKAMTNNVKSFEENKPDALLDLGTDILEVLMKHFQGINQVKKETNELNKRNGDAQVQAPQQILPHVMHYSYDAKLHPSVPETRHASIPRPEATEEEKKEVRIKELFAPLSTKLLNIVGINSPADLPVPAPLREKAYQLLKEKLVPELMNTLYKEIIDPHTLNTIVLSSLEGLEKNLDNWGKSAEAPPKPDAAPYSQQRRLDNACAQLVSELVKFAPPSISKVLFSSDKVKQMVGSTIGRVVRNKLSETSLLKLIDLGMEKGLTNPAFHAGEWKGEKGAEVLKPRRLVRIDEEGNRITVAAPEGEDFEFNFPKTAEEKRAKELLKEQDRARVKARLKKKAKVIANKAAQVALKSTIKNIWNRIQNFLDRICSKIPGGMVIKRVLDKVCRAIFIVGIGTVMNILLFPFKKMLWWIVSRYLKHRIDAVDIVGLLEMPIHENLFAKTFEKIVNKLDSGNSTSTSTQEPEVEMPSLETAAPTV